MKVNTYLRTRSKKDGSFQPQALVRAEINDDGKGRFGFSMLNPMDQFRKSTARSIADSRMKDSPEFNLADPQSLLEAIYDLPHKLHPTGLLLAQRLLRRHKKNKTEPNYN